MHYTDLMVGQEAIVTIVIAIIVGYYLLTHKVQGSNKSNNTNTNTNNSNTSNQNNNINNNNNSK